jgi:hypothetical protein
MWISYNGFHRPLQDDFITLTFGKEAKKGGLYISFSLVAFYLLKVILEWVLNNWTNFIID